MVIAENFDIADGRHSRGVLRNESPQIIMGFLCGIDDDIAVNQHHARLPGNSRSWRCLALPDCRVVDVCQRIHLSKTRQRSSHGRTLSSRHFFEFDGQLIYQRHVNRHPSSPPGYTCGYLPAIRGDCPAVSPCR